MSASRTGLSTLIPSAWAICDRREDAESESNGVNLNFEQRDARGSMILGMTFRHKTKRVSVAWRTSSHNCTPDRTLLFVRRFPLFAGERLEHPASWSLLRQG